MNFKKVYLLILFIVSLSSRSAVWTATSCPATLGTSTYPFWNGSTQLTSANLTNGDILVIPAGCTITISSGVNFTKNITIQLNGCLNFSNSGASLDLTASSMIVATTTTGCITGVSSSNQKKIGTGPAEYKGPDPINGPFIISNGFLPIELIAFTGNLEVKVVFLNWKTATETNNAYFEIEKSSDGITFTKINSIKSKANDGNSVVMLDYEAVDNDLKHPLYYYRLKQVDHNGTYIYSNSISVKNHSPELKIYPKPNNGTFWIDVPTAKTNQKVSVKIYDQLSNEVLNNEYTVVNDNITGASVKLNQANH